MLATPDCLAGAVLHRSGRCSSCCGLGCDAIGCAETSGGEGNKDVVACSELLLPDPCALAWCCSSLPALCWSSQCSSTSCCVMSWTNGTPGFCWMQGAAPGRDSPVQGCCCCCCHAPREGSEAMAHGASVSVRCLLSGRSPSSLTGHDAGSACSKNRSQILEKDPNKRKKLDTARSCHPPAQNPTAAGAGLALASGRPLRGRKGGLVKTRGTTSWGATQAGCWRGVLTKSVGQRARLRVALQQASLAGCCTEGLLGFPRYMLR